MSQPARPLRPTKSASPLGPWRGTSCKVRIFPCHPVRIIVNTGCLLSRCRRPNDPHLSPRLPHGFALDRLALTSDPTPRGLAALQTARDSHHLGADPVLEDDVADAQLE